jgi:HK97 family phage major capsid protein
MIPFSSQLLAQTNPSEEALAREVGEVVRAGVLGYDREEVQRIRAQQWGVQRALSWQDETAGGALVGPPIMGELIDLLRPNEVLIAAGARILAMPPNGRLTYPRQTGTTTAYWVSESQAFSETAPTTGDVNLQAKKLGLLVKIPNELFRFSSVSIEQFIREDIARTIALKLDKDLLEGIGSATQPKGLINYAGINTYTSLGADTNGDTFQPNDVYRMIATVEQKNATFKAFIMRPLLYAAIANRRADAVSAGDQKGPYVFNLFREVGANMDVERLKVGNLAGYPVHKSSQLAADRVKGSGNNLVYVLGGDFSDLLIALSGAMEFMVSTQGDTPFVYDQTWFRSLLYVDSAPRREASFILCDKLLEQ